MRRGGRDVELLFLVGDVEMKLAQNIDADGQVVAYFAAVNFGLHTFYLDGASIPDNGGASWLLMRDMLHRAWKPDAKIFLGMHESDAKWAGRENILLSRQHLRISELPGAIVWFRLCAWVKSRAAWTASLAPPPGFVAPRRSTF